MKQVHNNDINNRGDRDVRPRFDDLYTRIKDRLRNLMNNKEIIPNQ